MPGLFLAILSQITVSANTPVQLSLLFNHGPRFRISNPVVETRTSYMLAVVCHHRGRGLYMTSRQQYSTILRHPIAPVRERRDDFDASHRTCILFYPS